MIHWGGPVKYIDLSRATPYIVLNKKEKKAMIKELGYKISEKDLLRLFKFLEYREIVHIEFKDENESK